MSPGAVFHPGHDEWHGQTVVVFTRGKLTVIGRWDAVVGADVHVRGASVHDADAAGETREEWIARLKQYGVPAEQRVYAVPHGEIDRVTRLRDA